MKYTIGNKNIQRFFSYYKNTFRTEKILNLLTQREYEVLNSDEFIITFENGNEVGSSELVVSEIVEDETLSVKFDGEGVSVEIIYDADELVINKQVNILYSKEVIRNIDTEVIDFGSNKDVFYSKDQKNISEMADFEGYYVEAGQPIYANGFFMGMEFPMALNKIIGTKLISRYFVGDKVNDIKSVWPTVIGSAESTKLEKVQKAFYNYIRSISQPNYFRKQYNTWYDYMKDIDEEKIIESFSNISKGFKKHGVKLDAYVVDDGWVNYESFWGFNEKFPDELHNIKELVKTLDSSLGLWIGPRGGYGGTEETFSNWLEKNKDLQLGSKNKLSNDVNLADLNYQKNLLKLMVDYTKKFNLTYWKMDGMLLKPDEPDNSGDYAMYSMTQVYEYYIELFTAIRDVNPEIWINLTSYVNPSPWFLKWVNSLWIQNSQDVGFSELGDSSVDKMMTYRDQKYEEFITDRKIQLPLWSLYNHDPVVALTAHTGYLDSPIQVSAEELYKYLLFTSTRGNGLWDFHYSDSMFDEDMWRANAKAIKWIEENYNILKNSVMIGGSPSKYNIYGYECISDSNLERIVSFRNPSNKVQNYNYGIQNLIIESIEVVYGELNSDVGEGTISINLKPFEQVIIKIKGRGKDNV
ncbi:alpha-N-acetylgalactosaminidase [Globicatella sanguinis]|uniref:alpha-N-acetylgalactosaminidase n=1 Tax=Globicatella sanguinis TaxID=13076 RepID=UPI00254391A5|nr:alpha-N-acetylgalactosaminidase [Globicatella sanguinis]MDK7631685.1 alpha-N-acetylgalactosaminidase [Globicatella sanguinis]WIK66206.1 alpha-N-acetylgalactosaminidase [Globicatella sanguinis]WKT55611.1 alpha-N-acetylgalactosaminidase [Globicatella sanguinis]